MKDLHFAAPQHVHWIWLLLVVVGALVWLESRGSAALDRFLSRVMRRRLVARPSRARRLLRIGLLGASGLALIVALMRPQFGMRFVHTPRVGAEIMVCLDVSKSMLAADVAPNRLGRAKAEVDDLLHYLDGDHVGLIAFAGKATVLCPLTPDFGFLELCLRSAGPQSVARGGTNLEAPILEALAGFRGEADVSRAILLITDGEDHDSFPLEAAKAAAQRGVRILAIGFGDEAGSKILVEDPKTGARETLRDADGKPVISRLDGETLRKMALATGGAYIPAGTGALDLASIYDAHIARLTRGELDDRGHMVRSEGFQAAVLAALLLLLASVAVASTGSRRTGVVAPLVVLGVLVGLAAPARADETGDMRTRYNRGARALAAGDLDVAARELKAARRATGSDGEARYAAAYDLGWVEVRRAAAKLQGEPKTALGHLHAAADWFRDAVRLRPEREDARRNLDIVTRRILQLADALAKKDPRDVAARIDEIVRAQRALMPGLAEAVQRERAETAGSPPPASDRGAYHHLAVEQRKILADLGRLAGDVREEGQALAQRKKEEQTPASRVRGAQLAGASHFLERATQRLAQARSQVRRRQAMRAFRRASAGLDELLRARDAFRDPAELLGVLITEGTGLAAQTARLAAASKPRPASAPGVEKKGETSEPPAAPAWLDVRHLEERQVPQSERLGELITRLQAALAGQVKHAGASGKGPGAAPAAGRLDAKATAHLLAQVRAAMPFLKTAKEAYDAVPLALAEPDLRAALDAHRRALEALTAARERFLDLRGLIELVYGQEKRLQQALSAALAMKDTSLAELLPTLTDLQKRNLARGPRLASMLEEARAALARSSGAGHAGGNGKGGDDKQERAARAQRLEIASTLRDKAFDAMKGAAKALGASDANAATSKVDEATRHLEALRRLFFTVVERLREALRQQVELDDDTQKVAALEEAKKRPAALAPLGERQGALRKHVVGIAVALQAQAAQDPSAVAGRKPDPKSKAEAARRSETLKRAGALVGEGAKSMGTAHDGMRAAPPDLDAVRKAQDDATGKLAKALALLQPPPRTKRKPKGGKGQEKPKPGKRKKEEGKKGDEKQPEADPARLLQAVRDREARRQREKSRRKHGGYTPVEKDW